MCLLSVVYFISKGCNGGAWELPILIIKDNIQYFVTQRINFSIF